eukprot:5652901-Amphidinium_carterae.1
MPYSRQPTEVKDMTDRMVLPQQRQTLQMGFFSEAAGAAVKPRFSESSILDTASLGRIARNVQKLYSLAPVQGFTQQGTPRCLAVSGCVPEDTRRSWLEVRER